MIKKFAGVNNKKSPLFTKEDIFLTGDIFLQKML